MHAPTGQLITVGEMPQVSDGSVDGGAINGEASRARATLSPGGGGGPEASPGGEDAPQLQQPDAAIVLLEGFKNSVGTAKKVFAAIEEALDAVRPVWNAGTQSFVDQPDYRTRLAAVELYLAHTVGLPVQRNENLNINASANGPKVERRPATPAMLEALERKLARVRKEVAEKAATPV